MLATPKRSKTVAYSAQPIFESVPLNTVRGLRLSPTRVPGPFKGSHIFSYCVQRHCMFRSLSSTVGPIAFCSQFERFFHSLQYKTYHDLLRQDGFVVTTDEVSSQSEIFYRSLCGDRPAPRKPSMTTMNAVSIWATVRPNHQDSRLYLLGDL